MHTKAILKFLDMNHLDLHIHSTTPFLLTDYIPTAELVSTVFTSLILNSSVYYQPEVQYSPAGPSLAHIYQTSRPHPTHLLWIKHWNLVKVVAVHWPPAPLVAWTDSHLGLTGGLSPTWTWHFWPLPMNYIVVSWGGYGLCLHYTTCSAASPNFEPFTWPSNLLGVVHLQVCWRVWTLQHVLFQPLLLVSPIALLISKHLEYLTPLTPRQWRAISQPKDPIS